MPRRAFRVDEANALLPAMELVLAELDGWREEVRVRTDQLEVLKLLWGARLDDPACPDHGERAAHRIAVEEAGREMLRLVEEEIVARGIRFPPGGLEHGLLDFPTTWRGRWVYLCWRRGEPEVAAWHEVHAGFAGRRAVTSQQRAGMGADPLPDFPHPDLPLPDDSSPWP